MTSRNQPAVGTTSPKPTVVSVTSERLSASTQSLRAAGDAAETLRDMGQVEERPPEREQGRPGRDHDEQGHGARGCKGATARAGAPKRRPDAAREHARQCSAPLRVEERVEDVASGDSDQQKAGGGR